MTGLADPGEQVTRGLNELGYTDSEELAQRLLEYGALVLEANRTTNLVGAHSMDELVASHFLDSLAPLAGQRFRSPIADAGSGAGLPGIPFALAHTEAQVVLIEPRRLRAEFLTKTIEQLGLGNRVSVLQKTCETAGRSDEWRERFATVLVRAVAPPPTALELGIPLVRRGGYLWLYRGREHAPTDEDVALAKGLGAVSRDSRKVKVPFLEAERNVWIFRKVTNTPAAFPARKEMPERFKAMIE